MVGITAGSYTYMAPERFDSGPITGRADIYSLACVLYECLTGTTPFPVQNISNLIRSHLSESPPRPSLQRPDVPAALDAVIAHAMSKNPADRFAAAGEFAGAAHAAVGLSERADAEPPARGAELPTAGGSPFGLDPEPDREDIAATSQRLAAGPGAPRPVAEPNTFQPFGPQGPTIAAQFQPRGGAPEPRPEATGGVPPATGSQTTIMRTPATGDSTTTLVPRGPVPPVADDDIPAEPAPAPRGYETTGSLRIIAPPDPAQRDPDADLPVITPADPTRVRREEFELSPLPQRTPTGSLNLPPQAPVSQDAPRTELLPHGTTPGDRGGYADEPSRNIGYAQEHGGYDHDPYGEYAQPAAYSGYGSGDYDENGYDHGRYDEQAGYADERYHENYSEGYDYGRENYGSEDYGAGEYDDEQAAPKKRSIAMPIVFGVLGVALAAGAAVIGWQVLGKSGATSTAAARPSSPAAAAVDPATPDTSTAPDTTTAAAVSTPPAGSTACRPTSSTAGSPYTRSASGNSDTGCGFAEAVRKAYARAAAKDAESGSDAPSSVVAVSPATGRSYTMSCQATGRLITCTGGDDAVVYVY
jgi:serine/threonine-protein kinase